MTASLTIGVIGAGQVALAIYRSAAEGTRVYLGAAP